MSTRLISAIAAILATFGMMSTAAQARTHSLQDVVSFKDRASIAKNYQGKSKKIYAAKSKKTYASKTKKSRKYAKTGGKKRTYASKKGVKSRSFTKYASGGSSRTCLQPQARALLNRIESQFGSVSIVSTCRPGAVIATSGKPSKHRYGLAIDFDAGSRKGAIVNWLIKNHHSGGTMTYRGMNHIHVDIGHRFVSLGANSGRRRG